MPGPPFNYHGNNALQLKLYVDDGFFSPVEAVHSATEVASEAIGRADTVGTIEPGKIADIVVVDGSLEKTVDPPPRFSGNGHTRWRSGLL